MGQKRSVHRAEEWEKKRGVSAGAWPGSKQGVDAVELRGSGGIEVLDDHHLHPANVAPQHRPKRQDEGPERNPGAAILGLGEPVPYTKRFTWQVLPFPDLLLWGPTGSSFTGHWKKSHQLDPPPPRLEKCFFQR